MKKSQIEMRVVLARRAAQVRGELTWSTAIHGTTKVWLDYLHERRISTDLDFPVREPDHLPTERVEASSAQLVFSHPGFGEMVRPVNL